MIQLKKNKSGSGLLLFPTLAFMVALILFFLFKAPQINDSIGGKQAAVIRTVGLGEQELSFVDTAARLSAWQGLFELGENGGFYYDKGDMAEILPEEYPCDRYGYNLWNSKNTMCWPSADAVNEAYSQYIDRNLKENFLAQNPDAKLSKSDYAYDIQAEETTKRTIIRGLSEDSIPIPIIYELQVSDEKAGEEKLNKDKFPEGTFVNEINVNDEPITKCCDGNCVVNIAENYYNKYGAYSSLPLPYVWGGETPYDIDQTQEKTKDTKSFFYGASVTDLKPDPHANEKTVPGFDCSGFVWWVYKHAGLSGFNVRKGSEYETDAKNKGYELICGHSTQTCTLDLVKEKAQPGDVLFKHASASSAPNHVAIYIGDGNIIDSSSDNKGIGKRSLPEKWLAYLTVYRFPYNTGCTVQSTQERTPGASDEMSSLPAQPQTSATNEEQKTENKQTPTQIPKEDYDRIMQYDELIKKAAEKHEVPEALIKAVIMQESRGDTNAVSPTGCKGLMQFCAGTAIAYDLCDKRGCGYADYRTDPEKSIDGGARYLHDLLVQFKDYTHRDAFAIASYNGGQGIVKSIIMQTGSKDPLWPDVALQINARLVYENYCNGGKTKKGYFCEQGENCVNDRCAAKVNEVTNYVTRVLRYYSAFGGGSFSFTSDYKGATVSFTKKDIGYYYVNPSFTTEVNYDLSVYDGITAWARKLYDSCSGKQTDLARCVEDEKKKQNDAVDQAIKGLTSSVSGSLLDMLDFMSLANSNLLFKFMPTDSAACDGSELKSYFNFIETFEDCLDYKRQGCYCEFPTNTLTFLKVNVSAKRVSIYNAKGAIIDYYDISAPENFKLYHNNQEIDYMMVRGSKSNEYITEYYKNGVKIEAVSKEKFYFVKVKDGFEDFTTSLPELQKCDLAGSKHKFRFCAVPLQQIPKYENEKIKFKEVPIKFALDLTNPPPPPINKVGSVPVASTPEQEAEVSNAELLPKEKQCEGIGKAEFKLTSTTKDLKPAYDNFITSFATKLVPQLGVLLFAKNFFVAQNELPALVNVQLDLKGASDECDITGIVYKCGMGVPSFSNGKFDFSEPTGYIDLSGKFKAISSLDCDAPDSCTYFNNPDGSATQAKIRCTKPQISNDKNIIAFSISKCSDSILQYKKTSGLDVITAALNGFGYYFAFSYVDGAGNYGDATIESIQLPSVMKQLEEQLGLENLLLLKSVIMGDYENVFGLLEIDDELQFMRNALAGASLDKILSTMKGEALNSAYGEISKNIKNEDAADIVNDFARDAVDGRLDESYTDKIIEKLLENIDDSEADKALGKLLESEETKDAFINYLEELPDDKKKEVLEALGEEVSESTEGRVEVTGSAVAVTVHHEDIDEKWEALLEEARDNKEKLAEILQQLDPEERLVVLRQMAESAPDKALQALAEATGADKKAAAVRSILNSATDSESKLARLIAYASPDYVKKAAYDYLIQQVPGFDKYKDIVSVFEDFQGASCS